ncbi:MAG: hypothetical protein KDE27_12030 [Planctomycetes bacterium]|nr:hypothetical protein [Planctomycetota bacterium]
MRNGSAIAFDAVRGRTVLFGGARQLGWGPFGDTWEYDGARWSRRSPAASPPPRMFHALVFDSARGRTVMFGGAFSQTVYNDTWEYDGTIWTQSTPATSPPARSRHALAYDLGRQRTVLFGGTAPGLSFQLDDTWEYDGSNWTQIANSNPPSRRRGHAMAYDLGRQRVVLFGGWNGLVLPETYEYDGTSWRQVATVASPPARTDHALAYDPSRGRTVLFGGEVPSATTPFFFRDTWEYDGVTWNQVLPPLAFLGLYRTVSRLAFDSARARLVLFDGHDTFENGGTGWTTPAQPEPRFGHRLAYDSARRRTVLFGGARGSGFALGTAEWDGTTWTAAATTTSPPARLRFPMVYDSVRQRTMLFGGSGFSSALADTWEYDGANWSAVTPPTSPSARELSALAYDAARERAVLFGGWSNSGALNDTWEFDGANWIQVATASSPAARAGHAAAYDAARGRTVLFGGSVTGTQRNDTWAYDGVDWQPIPTIIAPSARSLHALVFDAGRGRTILFGGAGASSQELDDVWEFDGVDWTSLAIAEPLTGRAEHGMAYDLARGRVVVFGGYNTTWPIGDTAELVPASTPTWTPYGTGCPGSAGIPRLDAPATAQPALGSTFPLQLANLPAQPGAALLQFGVDLTHWGATPLPAALGAFGLPGCKLWIGAIAGANVLLPHTGTNLTYGLGLPANPALAGLAVDIQSLVLDAAAPSGIGALSNAVVLRLD